jgi:hypothetical protein
MTRTIAGLIHRSVINASKKIPFAVVPEFISTIEKYQLARNQAGGISTVHFQNHRLK